MQPPSCRLFVIRAFDAPTAVILRRGPTRWYHLILWDTDRDTFTEGAWFRGRISEYSSDLSPDGKLFVYSAQKVIRIGEKRVLNWTAVSRPPYVTPLAIWPQSWALEGGGRFLGNRRLALFCDPAVAHPGLPKGLELIEGSPWRHRSSTERLRSTDRVEGADWTGYDRLNRTLYTVGGKLIRRTDEGDQELADFSDLKPDPQPPPQWATRPL